jgi:hypothetical protein
MSSDMPMYGASPPVTMQDYLDFNFSSTLSAGAGDASAFDQLGNTSGMSCSR